jgi:hypothetical protein
MSMQASDSHLELLKRLKMMYSKRSSISSVKPGYDLGNLGQKRTFQIPFQKKRSIKSMDPEKNRPEIHRSGAQKKQEENGSDW